jgi:hypothetical protein
VVNGMPSLALPDQGDEAHFTAEKPKEFTREERLEAERRRTLRHYSSEQTNAALRLYKLVKRCPDTGGGIRVAKFLLGLYNGTRFPFDLSDMRCFDAENFEAAITLLRAESTNFWCEIHVLLNAILGPGANCGAEFESWAYDLRLPQRCKKENLPPLPAVDFR